jgi:hypothetical protein
MRSRSPLPAAAVAIVAVGIAGTACSPAQRASRTAAGATAAAANPGPLPFRLPAQSVLRSSKHKVFAHYFTPYPVSLDDKAAASDYYTKDYLSPTGENGKHAAYGGLLRDRPIARAPLSGDWQLEDMKTEVRRAAAAQAAIDGADWVQIPTWNDYSEGAQLSPSAKHGWTYLDLS